MIKNNIPEPDKEISVNFIHYLGDGLTECDVSILKKANGEIVVILRSHNSTFEIEIPSTKILALADYVEKLRHLEI